MQNFCEDVDPNSAEADRGDDMRLRDYLGGQGDLVSRVITLLTHIVTLVIPIINPLAKSP